jgi:hypothetical protein
VTLLTEHELHQHRATLTSLLDRVGEARLTDTGAEDDVRTLEAEANAPLDPPYQHAYFRYAEIYERRVSGWELIEYYYEFQLRPDPGRRAHHLHDPLGPHQHCVSPTAAAEDDHFVGGLMSLFDAHRDLLYWYAQDEGLNCDGLTPLFG